MSFLKGLGVDWSKAIGSLVSLGGPGLVRGAVLQFAEKRSAQEIFDFIRQNKGANVWELLSDDAKRKLILVEQRTGVLNQLSIEWLVDALKQERPDLASLALNSKEVRAFLRKAIRDIKKGAVSYTGQ